MWPKFCNIEIVLIYFLLLIPWPHTQVIKLLCSKDNSRLVRKIVRSKWTPILDKYQVKLPLECPLHPFRDLYAPRQDAKKRDRPTQWTCRLCGKSFYEEKFLDQHFERRHKSIINKAEDAVCLADLCDIMRCDVFQTEESSSLRVGEQNIVTDIEVWGDSLGQNSALAKANAVYLSLMPLRASTIGASRASKVQNQNRQLCQDQSGQTTFKDSVDSISSATGGGEKSTSSSSSSSSSNKSTMKKLNQGNTNQQNNAANNPKATANIKQSKSSRQTSASAKTTKKNQSDEESDDESDSTAAGSSGEHKKRPYGVKSEEHTKNTDEGEVESNHSANGNSNGNNAQKARANCKPEELSKLKVKCEHLVRSCIGSLLLSMSDQAFKEMESEMNKAICWYLSCDRYWEDGRTLEPRAFPWVLILILILVLSTGICFCYYIIWILFDSEESTINTNHHYVYAQQYVPHHMQHQYGLPAYPGVGGTVIGGTHGPEPEVMAPPPPYYHQQSAHDLYPEQVQYDYRHSPRRYIGEPRQQGTPTAIGGGHASSVTPLHHHHHHGPQQQQATVYQQDILDRRDYTSSGRPIATTSVSGGGGGGGGGVGGPNVGATSAVTHPPPTSMSASNIAGIAIRDSDTHMSMGGGVGGGGGVSGSGGIRHYNTHPRPLASQHRHVGASQQSLRGSSSTHEIVQNEIGHNEHYIYVTYPPDLKKRYFEKYE